jgi:transcription termination factor NusB
MLAAGGAAIMYSADQQKVMDVLIAAHGGGQQVDASSATGLRKMNQDLDAERGTVASERAAAVKAVEANRIEMRDSNTKRDEAQAKLDADKAELQTVRSKVEAMNESVEKVRVAFNTAVAELKNSEALSVDASADFATVLESIKGVVEREEKRTQEINERLNDWQAARAAATEKLAREKVELNRLTAINDKFFTDYTKNDDEFPVLAVDARWKFVVFNVGPDSGLVAGDANPMLVKRGDEVITALRIVTISKGMAVAEFDPAKLPAGIRPELGDRVFRVQPLGN